MIGSNEFPRKFETVYPEDGFAFIHYECPCGNGSIQESYNILDQTGIIYRLDMYCDTCNKKYNIIKCHTDDDFFGMIGKWYLKEK